MKTKITDYNGAASKIQRACTKEWAELEDALKSLPSYLKSSDQAGIQGRPIFDPIATNAFMRSYLERKGWKTKIPIPTKYRFLGTDIDLGRSGIIVEVQFSNYPFLLNNVLRSELFYKMEVEVDSKKTKLVIIITKGHIFPASNSTLYYEQAKNQMDELAAHNVFAVPTRLVGLMTPTGKNLPAVWTTYKDPRYSRTITTQKNIRCDISPGRSEKSRSSITIHKV